MADTDLTSSDVIDGTTITYRQLDHWVNEGHIRPAHRGRRRGNRHAWSEHDRSRLAAIDQLQGDLAALGIHHMPTKLVAEVWDCRTRELVIRTPTVSVHIRLGLED